MDEAHERGTPLKPTTIRKDLVFVGLVLRYAKEYEKVLTSLPEMPSFRGARWAIVSRGRPYFPPDEYKKLIRAAWLRMREPELNPRVRRQRTELYRMIHIMVGAALRVGEAQSLRWRDWRGVKLSDCGHFSYFDCPAKVHAAIDSLFQR